MSEPTQKLVIRWLIEWPLATHNFHTIQSHLCKVFAYLETKMPYHFTCKFGYLLVLMTNNFTTSMTDWQFRLSNCMNLVYVQIRGSIFVFYIWCENTVHSYFQLSIQGANFYQKKIQGQTNKQAMTVRANKQEVIGY